MLRLMGDMLKLIWWVVIGLFRPRASLEAEIVALRHQLKPLNKKRHFTRPSLTLSMRD